MARFNKALQEAKAQGPKPASLKGDAAVQQILNAAFVQSEPEVNVGDPLGLEHGTEVEVFPTDSGTKHHDRGRLIGLNEDEVVLSVQTQGRELRFHYPRTGFRVKAVRPGSHAKL